MIDLSPPPLIGFSKPAIIRPNDLPLLAAPFMPGFKAALVSAPPTIEFVSSYVDASDSTSYTFNNCNIGAAASNRTLVVVAGSRNSNDSSRTISLTINGVSAASQVSSGNGGTAIAILSLNVPTGTNASITVTHSGSTNRCGIAIYRTTGLTSPTATATLDTGGSVSGEDLNVQADGIVVAGHIVANQSGSWTWTGLTEGNDETVESTIRWSTAWGAFPEAQTPLAITAAIPGRTTSAFVAAAFR